MISKAETMKYPKFTIITPSYNQAFFLEQTILSVIEQNYPNLEYIIIDGGSYDSSLDIIRKYEKNIYFYISEKDSGQANAINKGLRKASGEIIGWLNSDDLLEKDALFKVAKSYINNRTDFIYGNGFVFYQNFPWLKKAIKPGLITSEQLTYSDPLLQPSVFWSRKVVDEVGYLDENLKYVLDWDFFIRIGKKFKLYYLDAYLSSYRFHSDHKTGKGGIERSQEVVNLIHKYASEEWKTIYSALYLEHGENIVKVKKKLKGYTWLFFYFYAHDIFNQYDLYKVKTAISML